MYTYIHIYYVYIHIHILYPYLLFEGGYCLQVCTTKNFRRAHEKATSLKGVSRFFLGVGFGGPNVTVRQSEKETWDLAGWSSYVILGQLKNGAQRILNGHVSMDMFLPFPANTGNDGRDRGWLESLTYSRMPVLCRRLLLTLTTTCLSALVPRRTSTWKLTAGT